MSSLTFTIGLTAILVFTVVNANIIQEAITRIQQKSLEDVCNVNINRQLIRCDVKPYDDTVPDGTICSFLNTGTHLDTVDIFVCHQGFLHNLDHTSTGTSTIHTLAKRCAKQVKRCVGNVFAIIFSLGLVCARYDCSSVCAANQPPTIDCPDVSDVVAEKTMKVAVVKWADPTTEDPENEITESGHSSGSFFRDGPHTISYTVSDDCKNKATCKVRFNVEVIYCDPHSDVEDGWVDCIRNDYIYGTTCSISCDTGYQHSEGSTTSITCDREGKWSPSSGSTCKMKYCSDPPHICNGKFKCKNQNAFQSRCSPICKPGYSTDNTQSIECNGDKWIGPTPVCKDIQPPDFTNCHKNFQIFAGRNGTEIVDWPTLIATDNSDLTDSCGIAASISIIQTTGKPPGSRLPIGFHEITYTATDGSNNKVTCSFTFTVEELSCHPLNLDDEFVTIRCPNGYSFGSTCFLGCNHNYPLIGDFNVTCEKDINDDTKVFWDWTNNTISYCEKLDCPKLPVPAGGALACSQALGNEICTMSCSDKYQVAKGTPIRYICNSDQVWIQGMPPNCTDRVHPSNAIKPGELLYYYSGKCSDPTVQTLIKQNFVKNMKDLETTEGWTNVCPKFYTIEGVTVTCGPFNGRRRRHIYSMKDFSKRSPNQISVSFKISSEWEINKNIWDNDATLTTISNILKANVKNGTFDVSGVNTGRMTVGFIEFSCPVGLESVFDGEGRCVGCPPGKYLAGRKCRDCAKGYYQENEYQINCTQCPAGQSTRENGSKSLNDCQDMCPPGTFSNTGLMPCSPCPRGQYQALSGSQTCLSCVSPNFTISSGSTSESSCHLMDVTFKTENASMRLQPLSNDLKQFSLGFFMKCKYITDQRPIITIANFSIMLGKQIELSIAGTHFNSSYNIGITQWTQISTTWQESKMETIIYANGKQIGSYANYSTEEIKVLSGSYVEIKSSKAACSMTGFFMVAEVLDSHAIGLLTNTCVPSLSMSSSVYTMDHVFSSDMEGTDMSYSTCDAFDDCASTPCWNRENICINKQDGYECHCFGGYKGLNCEIPPDFCSSNSCSNGATCVSHFVNFTCICTEGFTGDLCETEIVNGNWGAWLKLSGCSATCNGGIKARVRYCNDPSPDPYGLDCIGKNVSEDVCNTQECPVCPPYYTIIEYKNKFNCTTDKEAISCTVTCKSGYLFARDYQPLDLYECGPHTGYSWNGVPPPCAATISPIGIEAQTKVKYSVDCNDHAQITIALSKSVQDLQCVRNKTCRVKTSTSGCSNTNRGKRSLASLDATIHITSTLSEDNMLNLEDFFEHHIVSPGLTEMINAYTDSAMSLQQMNSTDILTVDVNGAQYVADTSSMSVTTAVICRDGSVKQELICAECPLGTYWLNRVCEMCPKGTFQNESGQTTCIKCPDGYITSYVASREESACSVLLVTTTAKADTTTGFYVQHVTLQQNESDNHILVTAISVSVAVVFAIALTSFIIWKYMQHRRAVKSYDTTESIIKGDILEMEHPNTTNGKNIADEPRYTQPPMLGFE